MQEGKKITTAPIFLGSEVKKGAYSPIRIRFDTALKIAGKQWFEAYREAGISKCYASQIRNGHIIPPAPLRTRIASIIGVDTSALWEAQDILHSDNGEEKT